MLSWTYDNLHWEDFLPKSVAFRSHRKSEWIEVGNRFKIGPLACFYRSSSKSSGRHVWRGRTKWQSCDTAEAPASFGSDVRTNFCLPSRNEKGEKMTKSQKNTHICRHLRCCVKQRSSEKHPLWHDRTFKDGCLKREPNVQIIHVRPYM